MIGSRRPGVSKAGNLAVCLTLVCLAWAACLGCSSAPKTGKVSAPNQIVEVNVITAPVGINLDGRPGVDGFSMKVYVNDASHPKTVPIKSGSIEIRMFNGTLYGRTNLPEAAKTWRFELADLKNREVESSIGTGYDFVLMWGTNRPTERLITVMARYTDPTGRAVVSQPSSVTVFDR